MAEIVHVDGVMMVSIYGYRLAQAFLCPLSAEHV